MQEIPRQSSKEQAVNLPRPDPRAFSVDTGEQKDGFDEAPSRRDRTRVRTDADGVREGVGFTPKKTRVYDNRGENTVFYNKEKKLGEGCFGEVHRFDGPGGSVAVKIQKPIQPRNQGTVYDVTMAQEVALTRQALGVGVFVLDDSSFVMPYFFGLDPLDILYDRIKKQENVFGAMRYLLFYSCEIAKSLELIHKRGIVHRDLKIDNVLIEVDQTTGRSCGARIIDFGMAAKIGEGTSAGLYASHRAPETVFKGAKTHPSQDVYSLGVLLLGFLEHFSRYDIFQQCYGSHVSEFTNKIFSAVFKCGRQTVVSKQELIAFEEGCFFLDFQTNGVIKEFLKIIAMMTRYRAKDRLTLAMVIEFLSKLAAIKDFQPFEPAPVVAKAVSFEEFGMESDLESGSEGNPQYVSSEPFPFFCRRGARAPGAVQSLPGLKVYSDGDFELADPGCI